MSSELKVKTKSGLLWSTIDRFSTQGISFIFSIFLARILAPKDYGIVAMITVFIALAQAFVDSGFSSALIRKPNLKEEDKSTAFYFNIIVGFVCYGILLLISPFVADFYSEPLLNIILKITGLSVIFNSLCVVQRAVFTIDVNFKIQAKISLTCTVVTGIIGLLMAYTGYGIWALVVQSSLSSFLNCILLWWFSKWFPKTGFHKESFKYLFGFGSKLLASELINTTYNNIYPIVIGKFYSPIQLGYFSRAQGYAGLPSSNITGILQRVTFPVLSLIQSDDKRLSIEYRKILKVAAFVIFPLMMGLAAVADPLVKILITSKWEGCILYLQIICFGMMWYPIHAINLNLLQVKGRSDLFLRLEIIKKVIGILTLCITIPIGVTAMCIGMVINSIISLIINTHYTGKLINVTFLIQMKDIAPSLFNSLLMGLLVYGVTFFSDNLYFSLFGGIIIGVMYMALSSLLTNSYEVRQIHDFFKK